MHVVKYMFQPHGDDRGQLVALEEMKDKKNKLTDIQKEFFGKTEELNSQMLSLDKEVNRLSSRKEKCQDAIESQINYMWNEYELTYNMSKKLSYSSLLFLKYKSYKHSINSLFSSS